VTAMTSTQPTWEEVLADVEADVARTEALVRNVTTPAGELRLTPLSPAEMMLPAPPAPRLPDLAVMPRVPVELLQRVNTLRERIADVGRELMAALEDVSVYLAAPAATEMAVFPSRPVPPPRFVDRAL
jgi:hypothetical protein